MNTLTIQAEPEITTTALAHHFSVGEATVRRWEKQGMPARACNKRVFRYRISEVEKWIDAKKNSPQEVK
jgi:hypothetical protein